MIKVLVTGATGFLGYHIISKLLDYDVDIIATSNEPIHIASKNNWFDKVKYVSCDLNSIKNTVYSDFGLPDLLIHLAWQGLPNYNEDYHIEINQRISLDFISSMVNSGLRNVAVSGTCFEYGMTDGCLSEKMKTRPSNKYGLAKDNLRKELEKIKGINLTWARFFYIYGQQQSGNSLLGQLQNSIKQGDKVFNMSPGDQLRDFIEVEKAADMFVRLAFNGLNNGVVNICSGNPISVLTFVKDQLKKMNSNMKLNTGYYPYSEFEPKNFWGDTEKLRSLLGRQ